MEDFVTLWRELVVTLPSKLINCAIAVFSLLHRLHLKVSALIIHRILNFHIFSGCDLRCQLFDNHSVLNFTEFDVGRFQGILYFYFLVRIGAEGATK